MAALGAVVAERAVAVVAEAAVVVAVVVAAVDGKPSFPHRLRSTCHIQLSKIRDEHHVAELNASRNCQLLTIARPIKPEKTIAREVG